MLYRMRKGGFNNRILLVAEEVVARVLEWSNPSLRGELEMTSPVAKAERLIISPQNHSKKRRARSDT